MGGQIKRGQQKEQHMGSSETHEKLLEIVWEMSWAAARSVRLMILEPTDIFCSHTDHFT